MSKSPTKARTTNKRAGTKAKVAAAQKRNSERSSARKPAADRDPPESYRSLAAEYPWLAIGVGLLGGAVVASLLPKGTAKKLSKSAVAAAAMGSEIASAFARQTREAAHDGLGALEDIGGNAAQIAGKAGKLGGEVAEKAGEAAERARSGGLALFQEAIKLAGRVRR